MRKRSRGSGSAPRTSPRSRKPSKHPAPAGPGCPGPRSAATARPNSTPTASRCAAWCVPTAACPTRRMSQASWPWWAALTEGTQMRAVLVSEFGGPEQLRPVRVADPVAGPGQVRVAVRAAGLNPVDAGNRADGRWAGLRVPCILGYDIAGVIDGVGPGVTGLAPGDRVMAMTHFPIGAATSFADAAATPLAAGTAHLVLARLALPPGSRLLVLGASGGVGLFLLQLAAAAGITTIGVGREAMHAQMRGLGAAACIDYTREDVAARARALADGPVDAVADLVGGRLARSACAALRPGGQIAAIATPDLDLDPLLDANITFHGVLIQDDGDRTRALADLLGRRELRPVISHVLPLDAAAEAHRILAAGHAGGRIVLDVTGSLK